MPEYPNIQFLYNRPARLVPRTERAVGVILEVPGESEELPGIVRPGADPDEAVGQRFRFLGVTLQNAETGEVCQQFRVVRTPTEGAFQERRSQVQLTVFGQGLRRPEDIPDGLGAGIAHLKPGVIPQSYALLECLRGREPQHLRRKEGDCDKERRGLQEADLGGPVRPARSLARTAVPSLALLESTSPLAFR
jgi:hypothetical protein